MKKATPDRRKLRTSRKLDEKKVLELRGQGLAVTDIATHQGVAPSTIWRFLDRTKPQQEALERYKTGRADVFADIQARSLHVQARILDSLDQDGVVETLTSSQKSGLLHVLNAQTGTLFDKERLEVGKSTENHSILHKMMGQAFERLHQPESASPVDKQLDQQEDSAQ